MSRPSPTLSAGTLLVAAAIIAAACADKAVAPEDAAVTPPEETENVYVVAEDQDGDNLILNGRFFGSRNDVAVILSHMRPNDQTAWFDFAEQLADQGYAVLTYDFRGYGESEGSQDFDTLDDDLRTVLQYVRDRGKERVFLVGASMGGTTSLVVAGELDVQGVVALSAPAEFEAQNAVEAMPNVSEPALLIAAEGDTQAVISIEELTAAATSPVDTDTSFTGNLHGTALLQPESEHRDAVSDRIIAFLNEHR